MKNLKYFAAGCSFLYIVTFLFLSVITVRFMPKGLNGIDCLSVATVAGLLPIIAGIVMILLILLTEKGMTSGIACGVCAFVPLISFLLLQGTAASYLDLATPGASILAGIALVPGAGVILPILLGIAAAVLCFLADRNIQPKPQREAGLGSTIDEDW